MTTMIGNRRKPWRGYGAYNTLHAIRLHFRQDGIIDPAECKGTAGQLVLQANKPFHVGTIPAGSFILPPTADVITALAGGGTLDIGTDDDPDGILPSAGLAPAATGLKLNVATGALLGYTNADLYIYAYLSAAAATGEADVLIPFYTSAD